MGSMLGNGFRLWVAWVDGRAAAAILVLHGPNAHYTRGAMDHDLAGPVHANDLLHRMAIEEACQEGCRHYHMGESGSSESLARFKERFGAEAHDYSEYHMERLPIRGATVPLRQLVKRVIGFRD
jgi:lipid II:glycine glycyltransferase (peptidoglycan interpeptide bridge formation enzyme)